MAKPITIKITGDASGFKKTLGSVESRLSKFSTAAAGIAKVGAAAVAGVGLAAGAAAYKGITAFADFEASMNEVFTLLPDISGEAMAGMEDQVKDFSKSFGVLPSETIPALYQSLSAGIPPDNVFAFMETAQMAAKGGVTDLTTAVDGITSVVNAYGSEVVNSTQASDLMFTAVRLGKTTFEEMSASLSNVTPIASGLGVGFEEVTASIASLTAKGVPTAQATTQIRGALSDLAKEGSKSDKVFREISGGGFQDFISSGGTMAEAFQMMSDHADAAGGSVLDMFGRVEAGQAVMALTAGGGEDFASVLDEMGNSAGATEAAFETMDSGLSSAFEKIKANFAVILTDLGEKLAPHIQRAADWMVANSDRISAAFDTAMDYVGQAVEIGIRSVKWLIETFRKLWDSTKGYIIPAAEAIVEWFGKAVAWVKENWPQIQETFQTVWEAIEAVVAVIVEAIQWFIERFQNVNNDAEGEGSRLAETFEKVRTFITTAMEAIQAIVEKVIAVVQWVWENFGSDISALTEITFGYVLDIFNGFLDLTTGIFKTIKAVLTGDWSGAWDSIKETLSAATAIVALTLTSAWETLKVLFNTPLNWMKEKWKGLWDSLASFVKSGPIQTALAPVKAAIDAVKATIDFLIRRWHDLQRLMGKDTVVGGLANRSMTLAGRASAMGGPNGRTAIVRVGERGPENVILPRGAHVKPNHASGASGGNVNVNVQTNADPWEVGREVAWALKTAGV